MYIPYLLLATAASFLFLTLVFRPIEWAFPAKPGQKFLRPHFFTDLCFFCGQYLLWNGLKPFPTSFAVPYIRCRARSSGRAARSRG